MPSARSPKPGAMMAPGLPTTCSTIAVSVVMSSAAIDAALSSAARVTLSGSITPSSNMSPYSPVRALNPCPSGRSSTICTTSSASKPALMRDPAQRLGKRPAHHLGTDRLVARQVQVGQRTVRLGQRGATAGDDAGLQGRSRRGQRVIHPQHALLELHAGGAADSNHRDPAGQPGDAQLEAVPVGVDPGPFALSLELADASIDQLLLAVCADDRCLVLGHRDPIAGPQVLPRDSRTARCRCPWR